MAPKKSLGHFPSCPSPKARKTLVCFPSPCLLCICLPDSSKNETAEPTISTIYYLLYIYILKLYISIAKKLIPGPRDHSISISGSVSNFCACMICPRYVTSTLLPLPLFQQGCDASYPSHPMATTTTRFIRLQKQIQKCQDQTVKRTWRCAEISSKTRGSSSDGRDNISEM